jgi:alanine racemase
MTAVDAAYATAVGAIPVINSLAQAQIWLSAGGGPCDLMIDTGINRLGLEPDNASNPLIQQLEVQTLMSHLACADEDTAMNETQLARFRDVLPLVEHKAESLCNSAGIGLGADYAFDLTRPGLALFGGVPREELAGSILQVARPEAAIIQCRNLSEGDTVGYNAMFTAQKDMRIGIVSIGYADGLLISHGKNGYLTSGETHLPLVGKVSMDMIAVDLSGANSLSEGDWLELPYSLPHAARQTSLSQYELLTILGARLRQN